MARRKKQIIPLDLSNPMLVRDDIVDDLLRKFPLGPNKTLTRDDYHTTWDGHPRLSAEETRDGFHNDSCGYPDLVLYRLKLTGWAVRDYIRQRWPDLKRAGVTRRANRLEKRLCGAARRQERLGLPGLWQVSFGWEDRNEVVVFAQNKEHADQQAMMFFGAGFSESAKERKNISFVGEGSPLDVPRHNKSATKELSRVLQKQKERAAKLAAEIERMEYLATCHEVYNVAVVGEA